MPLYHAIGTALVSELELREKEALGQIEAFESASRAKSKKASVEFSTGSLTLENMLESFESEAGEVVPFQEIGIGRPLAVELRHLYTGKHPETNFFNRESDLLVTSAMKSIATFDAAPRAINFMSSEVKPRTNISQSAATRQGTPLIHYSPALTEYNTVLTLEMGFDEFDGRLLDTLASAFQAAAGMPIFMSTSQYLMAASMVTKISRDLGSALFDNEPVFEATTAIELMRPGSMQSWSGFKLIVDSSFDQGVLRDFHVNQAGQLVNSSHERYNGKHPYMIISLDGRENASYKNFAPTAASAALLEKFYRMKSGQSNDLDPLLDALNLYNDWKFRQKADELADQLKRFEKGTTEHQRKQTEYKAAVANILEKALRPVPN